MPQTDTPDQPRGYSHFDPWQKQPRQCPHCQWQGVAGECTVGESYHNLTGMDCPRCAEELFVLTATTIEEVLANWDRMTDAERQGYERFRRHHQEFAARALTAPEQLPDLEGDRLVLTWDFQSEPGETNNETVIKHGDMIIWSEPAFYEGFERFGAVAQILRQRYGTRLHDLIPTDASKLYLYGDASLSGSSIALVRKELQQDQTVAKRRSRTRKPSE